MHGVSPADHPFSSTARESFVEPATGLRDISLEQLLATFAISDMLVIDSYQQRASIEQLSYKPLPEDITQKYGTLTEMLRDNTSTYDDEGEDLLVDDVIICKIMAARRGQSNNPELTSLFRVRRSVVAFILFRWDSINEGEQPLRAS